MNQKEEAAAADHQYPPLSPSFSLKDWREENPVSLFSCVREREEGKWWRRDSQFCCAQRTQSTWRRSTEGTMGCSWKCWGKKERNGTSTELHVGSFPMTMRLADTVALSSPEVAAMLTPMSSGSVGSSTSWRNSTSWRRRFWVFASGTRYSHISLHYPKPNIEISFHLKMGLF